MPLLIAAPLERLKEQIIRPDFRDEHLYPLLRYRGAMNLGRAHRLWNFTLNMMESNATRFKHAAIMRQNPAFTHLCGPERGPEADTMQKFFSRLYHNPRVTENIPHLTEYVRDVFGNEEHIWRRMPWTITPVSEFTYDSHCKVPWRTYKAKARKPRIITIKPAEIVYPFLIHRPVDGRKEYEMMLAVNAAVPKGWSPDLRADVCQDLIVEILTGTLSIEDLKEGKRKFMGKVASRHREKYGHVSMDDLLSGDDERTGHDVRLPTGALDGMEW